MSEQYSATNIMVPIALSNLIVAISRGGLSS
jgi:hypothetical protein